LGSNENGGSRCAWQLGERLPNTDNLEKGYQTQVWLAVSNDKEARVSGRYFHHKRQDDYLPVANDTKVQEKFLAMCEQVTGVHFPVDPTL
jgi:hypothetical protein